LVACGKDSEPQTPNNGTTGTNGTSNNTTGDECVPDRAAWDAEISAIVETHCGTCHGAQPNFGAPHTLTTYEGITAQGAELALNELAASRDGFGTMPPSGVPDLPDEALAAFVDWASCGTLEPELGTGLKVDRPVFLAPEESP